MRTWLMWVATGLFITVGLVLLLGTGLTLLLVAAIIPYILVTYLIRKQEVNATKQSIERYVQLRRHTLIEG